MRLLHKDQIPTMEAALKYHEDNNIPLEENIFRAGSKNHFKLLETAAKAKKTIYDHSFTDYDHDLAGTKHVGLWYVYEGKKIPLDYILPNKNINEADDSIPVFDYGIDDSKAKTKYFRVYVMPDEESKEIKVVNFGAKGLGYHIHEADHIKAFNSKNAGTADKTNPTYWARRLPAYAKSLAICGESHVY